jgi:hypothetical protein
MRGSAPTPSRSEKFPRNRGRSSCFHFLRVKRTVFSVWGGIIRDPFREILPPIAEIAGLRISLVTNLGDDLRLSFELEFCPS